MPVPRPSVRPDQEAVSILLVERRPLIRQGIQRLLEDSGHVTVLGDAVDCDEAIRLARRQRPRVIVINLNGSAVSVLDGARKLGRQFADIAVLVISPQADLVIQERLLQSGVAGCIDSRCSLDDLLEAIDRVSRGQRYLSDELAQKLAARRLPGAERPLFDDLTHRELQILLLVAEGRNTAQIARELCLTQKTVNTYRNRLLDKLDVGTEVGLLHLALRHGLVQGPEPG